MSVGSTIYEQRRQRSHAAQAVSLMGAIGDSREFSNYSLTRAIRAVADGAADKAGLEYAVSQQVIQVTGYQPRLRNSIVVPTALIGIPQTRDLTAGSASAGGYLIDSDVLDIFDFVRNRSFAFRLGAQILTGLRSNVSYAKMVSGSTGYWLANESMAITESTPSLGSLSLTPKTLGGFTEVSRQALYQSDAERIVAREFGLMMAAGVDAAVLTGSGAAGQPLGILGTSGVNVVSGTTLGWSGVLDFVVNSGVANLDCTGFATTPAVYKTLSTREKATGSGCIAIDGKIDGRPLVHSTGVPSATLVGGAWSDIVVGEWGVLEVSSDAYTKFTSGIVGFRALWTIDVAIPRPAAFSVAASIT